MGSPVGPNPTPQSIQVAPGGGLTVSMATTTMTVYVVTEEKLEGISYLNTINAITLAASGIFAGSFVTLLTTLLATTLTDPTTHATFVIGTVTFGVLFLVSAGIFWAGISQSMQKMAEIRAAKAIGSITAA